MTTSGTSAINQRPCMYCGGSHPWEHCHRIKSIEYDPCGTVKRVEFHDQLPAPVPMPVPYPVQPVPHQPWQPPFYIGDHIGDPIVTCGPSGIAVAYGAP